MKNIKGIQCKINQYTVTAIAVVNGKPEQIVFKTNERDAREARKFAADKFGVKASQVLVSYELNKLNFNIHCDIDTLFGILNDANISYDVADNSEDEKE